MNAINSLEFVSGLWRRGSAAAKEKGASGFCVELELRGPAAVLHIAGRLTADRVEEVQKGLKQAKKKEADRIVVDLSACPYLRHWWRHWGRSGRRAGHSFLSA
jgi:hypothetical protein